MAPPSAGIGGTRSSRPAAACPAAIRPGARKATSPRRYESAEMQAVGRPFPRTRWGGLAGSAPRHAARPPIASVEDRAVSWRSDEGPRHEGPPRMSPTPWRSWATQGRMSRRIHRGESSRRRMRNPPPRGPCGPAGRHPDLLPGWKVSPSTQTLSLMSRIPTPWLSSKARAPPLVVTKLKRAKRRADE